jgi:hypothetical protein
MWSSCLLSPMELLVSSLVRISIFYSFAISFRFRLSYHSNIQRKYSRNCLTSRKMGFSKTDISVSTAASSAEETASQRSLDVTTSGGTPLSQMFLCCLPFGRHDETTLPTLEETKTRGLPPIVMAELTPDSEDETAFEPTSDLVPVQEEETMLFDTGLVCQITILGGILIGQALNVV